MVIFVCRKTSNLLRLYEIQPPIGWKLPKKHLNIGKSQLPEKHVIREKSFGAKLEVEPKYEGRVQ